MILQYFYMFIIGFVSINVEGFFIERFLNICKNKKILIKDLHRVNNTYINANILRSDFKEIKNIAKKTKCKVKIEKKRGVPFIINKYRKRKIFAVAFLVIAFFIFGVTQFVWNIEVQGNENISKDEIINLVSEYGIKVGKLKSNINTQKICNLIRLKRDDLSWIGINIKGTNVIVTVEEATELPDMIDKNEICNIYANSDAIILKITVQSGTARVLVNDEVKKGDLLVEGIMEGKYTGNREVHAEANILGKINYEKVKKGRFIEYEKKQTGNKEEKNEICINNFKINFNKRLSKFENYDTICTYKKIKLFSNFYIPIEIKKVTYIELENEQKEYTEDELKEKLEKELEDEMEKEYKITNYEDKDKKRTIDFFVEQDGITAKLVYEVQKEIGEKKEKGR